MCKYQVWTIFLSVQHCSQFGCYFFMFIYTWFFLLSLARSSVPLCTSSFRFPCFVAISFPTSLHNLISLPRMLHKFLLLLNLSSASIRHLSGSLSLSLCSFLLSSHLVRSFIRRTFASCIKHTSNFHANYSTENLPMHTIAPRQFRIAS